VVERVRRHAPDLDEARVQVRDSRAGRYQSVTVTICARDRAQLDAIYRDLSGHPQIKMVL
jgi:putative lipoic acid-binding regulatory protein